MQLSMRSATGVAAPRRVPAARNARVVVRASDFSDGSALRPSSVVGEKLGAWLDTPFDVLAFGARAGAGALVSAPERLANLQADIDAAMELVQDPRSLPEKQEVVLNELENRLLECLDKGAEVETDVLASLKTLLPEEAANFLTENIPQPPNTKVVMEDMAVDEYTMYEKEDVAASQIDGEVSEIRHAVMGLKESLEAIRSNTDPSSSSMLKLNLRESRDLLARRLQEVAVEDNVDESVTSATREAGILLDEVNAQFFSD